MEDGDTEKYHVSSLIQDLVFDSRKMGCIRCITLQVYNKYGYHPCFVLHCGNYILLLYIHFKQPFVIFYPLLLEELMSYRRDLLLSKYKVGK